jgi:hypothetical protein
LYQTKEALHNLSPTQLKAGIDPGTFRLVAQCVNHYATTLNYDYVQLQIVAYLRYFLISLKLPNKTLKVLSFYACPPGIAGRFTGLSQDCAQVRHESTLVHAAY